MKGLAAGRLNRRITVMRPVLIDDGRGEQDRTWQKVGTFWAEAISQNGREGLIAGAFQGVSAMRFTLRYRRDVDETCQIVYDGRTWNITSPPQDPDGRREALVILADTASTVPSAS